MTLPMAPCGLCPLRLLLSSLALLFPALAGSARGDAGTARDARAAVAKNASSAGALLRQDEGSRKMWLATPTDRALAAGTRLMALPGSHALIDGANVRVTLWGSAPTRAALPVMESIVRLNPKPTADMDLTLERGRLVLARRGTTGDAPRVRIVFQEQEYEVTLEDGNSEAGVEVFGRWPAGVPFQPRPAVEDRPEAFLAIYVLKGDVSLKIGPDHHLMRPPPGPCYFHWDSQTGADPGPRRRKNLPPWYEMDAARSADAKSQQAAYQRLGRQLANRPVVPVLSQARTANDPDTRRLAVYGLAAVDSVGEVVDALSDPQHADVRLAAAEALRNVIGRGPGIDRDLYKFLVDQRRYSPAQAEIVLQLLHGLSEDASTRLDTYETLIPYLRSARLPIRDLASGYLYRWVPSAQKEIIYDPAGSETQRQKAADAWAKMLAAGKLPPPADKDK